jgi:hypothetical protein
MKTANYQLRNPGIYILKKTHVPVHVYVYTRTRVKDAAIDCDIFWVAVLMHVVEYKEHK